MKRSDNNSLFKSKLTSFCKIFSVILERRPGLVQFVKFGLVGLLNTGLSYGISNAFFYLGRWGEQPSNIVTWIITVFISFMLNSRFVFHEEVVGRRPFWRPLFKVYLSYAATGLILIPLLTELETRFLGMPYYLITMVNIPISVPINFFLNKLFAYRSVRKRGCVLKDEELETL